MSDDEIIINQSEFSGITEAVVQKNLPNASGILIMGIISIAICWCYGIIGIVLGIISIVLSKKAKKLYNTNPEMYTVGSYKNMKVGRICSIIGLSLSSLFLIYVIIVVLFFGLGFGTASSSMPWDTFKYYE